MSKTTDSNALAFERLKGLIQEDKSLPEDVKKALISDCESTPLKTAELRKFFEVKDASTQ